MSTYLAPPRPGYINPDHFVPLSPPARPPFSHYHSSSSLPATPHTPLPPRQTATSPTSTTPLRPYLTLPSRLLLTTLSPALLPLILTIAHLIQNRSSTSALAASLKNTVLSACSGLAKGAASIQAIPRYLAMQTNDEVVRATQASILAIGTALMDVITIIEVVLGFIMDTYRSMLLCTIELAVRGTLEILIGAVDTISKGITDSLNTIRSSIQGDISSANNIIQSAVSKLNGVTGTLGITISVPEFSVPSLSALENVKVPTGFEDSLIKLNTTLPTLADLKAKLDEILEKPFEMLKAEMNETRLEMAASFNSSILPVPSLSALSAQNGNDLSNELCSGLDTSLIDDTAKALHKLSNVSIGLMFLLLFLVWAALCIWEWRRWKAMKETVDAVEEEWAMTGKKDPWRVVAIVEHPVLERYGTMVLHRLTPVERTRSNLRWLFAYLSHPTCLALLFIAALGFLSLQFQMVALEAIKNHAKANANGTVAASTSSLTNKLNIMAMGESQKYADEFNTAVARYQDRIDNELFGSWLNTTAITLNTTLVEFYDGIESALNMTFGGTILYNPFNTFLYCILGAKITNLEKGLTWLSQNAKITLPTLPPDILLLSNASLNELVSPVSAAAVGSGSDNDDGVVGSLIEHFESALRVERNFYAILLGVWLAFALIGVIVVLWHSGGRDRYLAWRGQGDTHGGHDGGGTWPWTKEKAPIYDEYTEQEKQFRGISPVPSGIPRIIEPEKQETFQSFLDLGPSDSIGANRPHPARNGTFGSTLSALAAPGQAFLKMTGRSKTEDNHHLVEKGASSEMYNSTHRNMNEPRSDVETPPPFWVNKFYRAVDTAKSYFPTRGQRHGAALQRDNSNHPSFGNDLESPNSNNVLGASTKEPNWTMIDRHNIGRTLDGPGETDSRYPTMSRTASGDTPPEAAIYPRRMSRASTVPEGYHLPNRFGLAPPLPVPTQKHDSIDYLTQDRNDDDDEEEEGEGEEELAYPHPHSYRRDADSPASSLQSSYFPHEAHLESVNKVSTGTSALAGILANMRRREESGNPFQDGYGEREREMGRGGRI